MCNPRRVQVRVAQEVREEWSRTVEERVTEQTDIAAEEVLETRIDLSADLGDIVLDELHMLLQEGYGEWQAAADDAYTLSLENGIVLRYQPASGVLQVVARLSDTVQAAASATSTASGIVEGSVEVEGHGHYYDDGWGGRTEESARRDAERDAQRRIAQAQEQVRTEQQRESLDAARAEAQEQARVAAQALLAEEAERRQAVLHEQVETLLRESEEDVQAAIGSVLGQAYRRALLRLARDNGGTVVQDSEENGTIDLVLRI